MDAENGDLDEEDIGNLEMVFSYANELISDIFVVVKNRWGRQEKYENMLLCLGNIKYYLELVYKKESEGDSTDEQCPF